MRSFFEMASPSSAPLSQLQLFSLFLPSLSVSPPVTLSLPLLSLFTTQKLLLMMPQGCGDNKGKEGGWYCTRRTE